jgi:hypothetical protein
LLGGQGEEFDVVEANVAIFDVVLEARKLLVFTRDEDNEAVIGRDLLDHFPVLFDGVRKRWRVLDEVAEAR